MEARARRTGRGRAPASAAVAVGAAALLVGLLAEAGWERQRMTLQDEDKGFEAVCAVAPDFAVAAGVVKAGGQDAGAIFATRDGRSWSAVTPPTSGGLLDIHMYLSCRFLDRQRGYVGGVGEIVVTEDGASSWTRVGLGGITSGKAILDIAAVASAGRAWAAVSNGDLLRSDDDGASWPVLGQPLGAVQLDRVAFVDSDHGWVGSGAESTDSETGEVTGYRDGGLAKTVDGGETWQVLFSGEARRVDALRFLDRQRGWMVSTSTSGSRLEATRDGGASWQPVGTPAESIAGPVASLSDVYFFDGCEGWLLGGAGANGSGALWKTRDGGASWLEHEDREPLTLGKVLGFPIEAKLRRFDFASREVGWASGTYETLFRYDADDGPPDCDDEPGPDGDGGPGDDDGGGRCSCRAAGAATAEAAPFALAALLLGAAAGLSRRRWKS